MTIKYVYLGNNAVICYELNRVLNPGDEFGEDAPDSIKQLCTKIGDTNTTVTETVNGNIENTEDK